MYPGGSVKAEGLGDGRTHRKNRHRQAALDAATRDLDDFAIALGDFLQFASCGKCRVCRMVTNRPVVPSIWLADWATEKAVEQRRGYGVRILWHR